MTAVDGMDDEIKELVAAYKLASKKLKAWREEHRPLRSVVYVECEKYKGFGIVNHDDHPTEYLSVRLENGNTWWYPIEKTFDAGRRMCDWPTWIKREKRIYPYNQPPEQMRD